ncbi:hypothetical protein ACTA71_009859 [Dictyostelium dimigraforme]
MGIFDIGDKIVDEIKKLSDLIQPPIKNSNQAIDSYIKLASSSQKVVESTFKPYREFGEQLQLYSNIIFPLIVALIVLSLLCGEDENKNNNDVNNNNNNLNASYDFIDIESLELIKNQFLSELLGLNEICDKSKQICKSTNESNLDMENTTVTASTPSTTTPSTPSTATPSTPSTTTTTTTTATRF